MGLLRNLMNSGLHHLDPKNLTKVADKATAEGAADTITYKIVVTDDDKEKHEFDIAEEALPAEMLDMIDDI